MKHLKRFLIPITALLFLAAPLAANAAAMSDYLEGQIIKYWFQNDGTAAAKPVTVYVGLSTTACSDSSVGTEVTGGSYARVAVTNNSTNWTGPVTNNATVRNGIAVTFPAPTANWNSVGWVHINDAPTGGNMLWCIALTTAKTVNNGDPAPSFAINALTQQVDN